MKLQHLWCGIGLLCLSLAAQAITMEEIHELQKASLAKSLKEGLEKDKVGKSDASGGPSMIAGSQQPAVYFKPVARDSIKDMTLTGLFGVGSDVEAKIVFRGEVTPLKKGMDIEGWVMTEIKDRCVEMSKRVPIKVKRKRKSSADTENRTVSLCIKTIARDYSVVNFNSTSPISGGTFPKTPNNNPLAILPPIPLR